ncbi:hypothetical protein FACS189490_01940 [Clostridia bacterium]|nr:hypothetical protein FACS189490_01940 [Clostridia bacterium]
MGERGKVVSIDGDFAVISITRSSACGSCHACTKTDKGQMLMRAKNEANAKVGDTAVVELKDGAFMKAVGIMFGAETLAFFAGLGVGFFISRVFGLSGRLDELLGLVTALVFVGLGYIFIHKNERKFRKGDFTPSVAGVVTNGD